MKQVRKVVAVLLVVLLLIGVMPSGVSAGEETVTVSLRVEYSDMALVPPTMIDVPVGRAISSYGLAIDGDPDYVTPLHVLAEYFTQNFGATPEDMTDYIAVTPSGFLTQIFYSSGSSDVSDKTNYSWTFSANDYAPMKDDVNGYLVSNYPVQDGDEITMSGVWIGVWPTIDSYYARFDKSEYLAVAGQPFKVKLEGRTAFSMGKVEMQPIEGAEILKDEHTGEGSMAITGMGILTDEQGSASITISTPGQYVISATRMNAAGEFPDITRPYAVITVKDEADLSEAEIVQMDEEALTLPSETTSEKLALPAKGNSGKTKIVWSSDKPEIISDQGVVQRPALGQKDEVVTLTATIGYVGSASQAAQGVRKFQVTVPAYSNRLSEIKLSAGSMSFDPEVLTYTVDVAVNADAVVITPVLEDKTAVLNVEGTAKEGDAYRADLIGKSTTVRMAVTSGGEARTYVLKFVKSISDGNTDGVWPVLRKDSSNNAVTGSYTARTLAEAKLNWKQQLSTNYSLGSPIIAGDYIYIASDNELIKMDLNGQIVGRGTLAGTVGYYAYSAFGDHKVFVPLSDGRVQALDAETLESLWISEKIDGHQMVSPIVYDNGYIYTGTFVGGVGGSTDGSYFCIETKDSDPSKKDEEQPYKWRYTSAASRKGFYWSGGAVVGKAIVFGGDGGQLVSLDRETGTVLDTYQAEGDIRCSIAYDKASERVFFTTKDGYIYSLAVESDGLIDETTVVKSKFAQTSSSSPVVANGRVYVGSGSFDYGEGDGGMHVLNADTLEQIYAADVGVIVQSSPIVTTAYGAKENAKKVYVYFTLNTEDGPIMVLEDSGTETQARVSVLYTPEKAVQNYCSASLIADEKGNLYYYNDSGNLFSVGSRGLFLTGLDFAEKTVTIQVGDSKTILPTFEPGDAADTDLIWSSSQENVATVQDGLIKGMQEGTTVIRARAVLGEGEDYYTLKVVKKSETTVDPEESDGPVEDDGDEEPSGEIPKTGEDARVYAWIGALIIAFAGIITGVLILWKRRQRKEK